MRFLSSIRIVRLSLALAVAFWMAGAGCLLGCQNMASAATLSEVATQQDTPQLIDSGDACASSQSHHCCGKHRGHSAAKTTARAERAETATTEPALAATPETMIDCPLAINATAALSKFGSDQSSVALLPISGRTSLSVLQERTKAFARPLRLPNRGHTHLRYCVFLI
jgi:hypothetical protein